MYFDETETTVAYTVVTGIAMVWATDITFV